MLAAECLPGGAAAVGMDAGVGVVALSALALMQRTGGLARTRQATGRCTDNAYWPGMAVAPGGQHPCAAAARVIGADSRSRDGRRDRIGAFIHHRCLLMLQLEMPCLVRARRRGVR